MRELLRRWRERVLRVQVEKWEKQGEPHVLAVTAARHPLAVSLAFLVWGLFQAFPGLVDDCSTCSSGMHRFARVSAWTTVVFWPLFGHGLARRMRQALEEYERRGNVVYWPQPFDWLDAARTVSAMASVVALGVLVVALVGAAWFAALIALGAAAVFVPLFAVLRVRRR